MLPSYRLEAFYNGKALVQFLGCYDQGCEEGGEENRNEEPSPLGADTEPALRIASCSAIEVDLGTERVERNLETR